MAYLVHYVIGNAHQDNPHAVEPNPREVRPRVDESAAAMRGQARYLSLDVCPSRQARNAAAACSRSSALLNLRRGCFGGSLATGVAPLISSTPRRCIRRRCFIRDQFVRPAITHFLATRALQQSRREDHGMNRRLCLSAPNNADGFPRALASSELSNRRSRPLFRPLCFAKRTGDARSDPAIIHPRNPKWVME